jgi:hypothetical protein
LKEKEWKEKQTEKQDMMTKENYKNREGITNGRRQATLEKRIRKKETVPKERKK